MKLNDKPKCNCPASTGIHDGLTFGRGTLDDHGFWEKPCSNCARWNEKEDNVPVGTYWPFDESHLFDEGMIIK